MDVFTSLRFRIKLLIVTSAVFLLSLSMGILIFGENVLNYENRLLEQVKEAAHADMLYVHPETE